MLIRCHKGCAFKKGTTTGSVDVEQDIVICNYCGDSIDGISSFAKKSMIQAGNVVKNDKRKAFQFDCLTCEKTVETELVSGELRGCDCDKQCKFNVSSFTISAMESFDSSD